MKKIITLTTILLLSIFSYLYSQEGSILNANFQPSPDYIEVGNTERLIQATLALPELENNGVQKNIKRNLVDIVFASADGLFVQRQNGTNRQLLLKKESKYIHFRFPTWSYDGKKIAVVAKISSNASDVILIDLVRWKARVIYSLDVSGTNFLGAEMNQISLSSDGQLLSVSSVALDVNFSVASTTFYNLFGDFLEGTLNGYTHGTFDPSPNSFKFAFTGINYTNGRSFIGVNDILRANREEVWFQSNDISVWGRVTWFQANVLYALRNDFELIRFPKNGNAVIAASGPANGTLQLGTFNKLRTRMYISTIKNNLSRLYECTLNTSGIILKWEFRGGGYDPSWARVAQNVATSVDEIPDNLFSFFPNPFSNKISFISSEIEVDYIELTTMNGQLVKFSKVMNKEVLLEDLTPNIYIMAVYGPQGKYLGTTKLIKY